MYTTTFLNRSPVRELALLIATLGCGTGDITLFAVPVAVTVGLRITFTLLVKVVGGDQANVE